jgi:ubiquitin-protein ligase
MQNRMAMPNDDAQPDHMIAQPAGIAWSPEQQVRLEHDWRQLQRNFAYHPVVRVIPLQGNPPAEYEVQFKTRALYIREDGELDFISTPSIHIWLPPGYPHEAPVVRPMHALFHPNVTMDGFGFNPPWDATRTLAQLVQQIGAMIAFHTYDPWNVWNPAAMDWATVNAAYLPTDPGANFAPNAGGEPLGRICQNGPRALEQLRGQLHEMCASLLSPEEPPAMEDVRNLAHQIRIVTNLFLDVDIPDSLRAPATELDQWAEALPAATMLFEGLRQRQIAASAALAAAGKVAESRRLLIKELASFDDLVIPRPSADPRLAIAQLPELPKMQAIWANFRVVAGEAEKRLVTARARLAVLAFPEARMSFSHSELLEKTIETQIGRATQAVNIAVEKSEAAIAALSPIVERAKDELSVFERVIGWREYVDLSSKAQALVERTIAWGSAGVQAYYVENEGGSFGPFEFEQRLDLGESALAVRNSGRTSIEIFDIITGGKVAKSDTGESIVKLPSGEPGVSYATRFRMTARCDDLWVQVEYLNRQIGEGLGRLLRPWAHPKAESWASSFDKVLSSKEAMSSFVDETRSGLLERNNLVSDLKLLSRFKERMTTQFLLERHTEMVGRFKKDLAAAQKELEDSNRRIAIVFSKSQREVETNQPMIPPRLANEYETQTRRRDNTQRKIDRLHRRFKQAAEQISFRFSNPALYGSDELPVPVSLPPLPAELSARVAVMNGEAMARQIATLENVLGVALRADAPAAAGTAAPHPRPLAIAEALVGRPMETSPDDADVSAEHHDSQNEQ